jgi:hypothetical protein
MKKSRKKKNLNLGVLSKALYTQQFNLALRQRHPATHKNNSGNIKGWYQARRQAQIRLRNMSAGNLVIHESGYRGDRERHWIQDGRCEHVFRAGLKEVFTIGADNICPFCQIPNDMHRCGSVGAVQQMVESLSYGNIEFLAENVLGKPDDHYEFACLIHQFRFRDTYRNFIREPENFCHICTFNNGQK